MKRNKSSVVLEVLQCCPLVVKLVNLWTNGIQIKYPLNIDIYSNLKQEYMTNFDFNRFYKRPQI